MTHEDLRKAAVKWLSNAKRCSVVLSEMVSACSETPDAIGWKYGFSYLVECKVSRSDFFANQYKPHVRSERGAGQLRYFLCPKEIIAVEDLVSDMAGWGLLWLRDSGRIEKLKDATTRDADSRSEIVMLASALRRVKTREFLTLNVSAEEERAS